MRDALIELLERADEAVAACSGVVGEDRLEPAARLLGNARLRLSYPEEVLVAAVVGGTGSGKSSLVNAIFGEDVVAVGGLRPTTSQPAAVVPASWASEIARYLHQLGISRIEGQSEIDWLCLIDLPDTDSVQVEHRLQVEALLPRVDVLIWVVDPEKYRDSALHHRYLRPLSGYQDQFVFVLNQVDRLGGDSAHMVRDDFVAALVDDGLTDPAVVSVSADPPLGGPEGIEELVGILERMTLNRDGVYRKLLADLTVMSGTLLSETGGVGVDYDRRAALVLDQAVSELVEGRVSRCRDLLVGFLDDLAGETGGQTGNQLSSIATSVPGHVERARRAVESARRPGHRFLRFLGVRGGAGQEMALEVARQSLGESIVRPARVHLARRAAANGALMELRLAVSEATERSSR